jgi:hypothetical protein
MFFQVKNKNHTPKQALNPRLFLGILLFPRSDFKLASVFFASCKEFLLIIVIFSLIN